MIRERKCPFSEGLCIFKRLGFPSPVQIDEWKQELLQDTSKLTPKKSYSTAPGLPRPLDTIIKIFYCQNYSVILQFYFRRKQLPLCQLITFVMRCHWEPSTARLENLMMTRTSLVIKEMSKSDKRYLKHQNNNITTFDLTKFSECT